MDEHIGMGSDWSYAGDAHVVIAHLRGPIREIDTQIEGVSVNVAPLGADDVSVIPAGRSYAAQARGGLVRFAELRLAPWLLGDGVGVRLVRRDAMLHRSIERLVELGGRVDDVARMAGHGICHAVSQHLRETYGEPAAAMESLPCALRAMEELRSYIRDNLDREITLPSLASVTGLTVNELLVAFRRRFGTTPAQFVIGERVERARWLLAHTAYDIATIALQAGFASHSHLTTTFRRHVGVTPRGFRAMIV